MGREVGGELKSIQVSKDGTAVFNTSDPCNHINRGTFTRIMRMRKRITKLYIDQRSWGLACAIGSHDSDDCPRRHAEAGVIEKQAVAIGLAKTLDVHHNVAEARPHRDGDSIQVCIPRVL